ncbi:hypothetical protein TrCOL_g10527 [Triparma columacea]|uniref:Uncharacterized protein n=1 Tax=Triparma columacea TaxID=722753 RepID=A0A9W7GF62_9STRA|nr:hypothetical protein TrCOL_g10527 [Triparma columacea]
MGFASNDFVSGTYTLFNFATVATAQDMVTLIVNRASSSTPFAILGRCVSHSGSLYGLKLHNTQYDARLHQPVHAEDIVVYTPTDNSVQRQESCLLHILFLATLEGVTGKALTSYTDESDLRELLETVNQLSNPGTADGTSSPTLDTCFDTSRINLALLLDTFTHQANAAQRGGRRINAQVAGNVPVTRANENDLKTAQAAQLLDLAASQMGTLSAATAAGTSSQGLTAAAITTLQEVVDGNKQERESNKETTMPFSVLKTNLSSLTADPTSAHGLRTLSLQKVTSLQSGIQALPAQSASIMDEYLSKLFGGEVPYLMFSYVLKDEAPGKVARQMHSPFFYMGGEVGMNDTAVVARFEAFNLLHVILRHQQGSIPKEKSDFVAFSETDEDTRITSLPSAALGALAVASALENFFGKGDKAAGLAMSLAHALLALGHRHDHCTMLQQMMWERPNPLANKANTSFVTLLVHQVTKRIEDSLKKWGKDALGSPHPPALEVLPAGKDLLEFLISVLKLDGYALANYEPFLTNVSNLAQAPTAASEEGQAHHRHSWSIKPYLSSEGRFVTPGKLPKPGSAQDKAILKAMTAEDGPHAGRRPCFPFHALGVCIERSCKRDHSVEERITAAQLKDWGWKNQAIRDYDQTATETPSKGKGGAKGQGGGKKKQDKGGEEGKAPAGA